MTASLAIARLRAHPVFFAVLVVLAVAAVGATTDLIRQELRWRASLRDCERLRLEQLAPHARPEMIVATRAELEREHARLQQARAEWPGADAAPESEDRLGAYAELAAFAERCRKAADHAGTTVAKDAHFGFARHAREAPAESEVALVLGQMRDIERVLGMLFKAGPERLLGVWRENPVTEAGGRVGSDWCALEVTRTVRVSDLVRTRAVRVAFVGTSACLRRFLNRLAAEPVLVVREVAVTVPEAKNGREKAARGVGAAQREFTVTLESVTVEGGTGSATREAMAQAPVVWRESEDGGCGFEVFAPAKLEFDGVKKRWIRPDGVGPTAEADEFGVTLVAVRRVSYRWRLAGVAGEGAERRALLEETATRRTALLRVGEREPKTGVTLETLCDERLPDGGRGVQAVLRDPEEREPVVLRTAARGPERLLAVLRIAGRAEPVTLAEGATVQAGGWSYSVGRIRAEPDSVEVSRAAADASVVPVRRMTISKR
jgi:hypothetical protein